MREDERRDDKRGEGTNSSGLRTNAREDTSLDPRSAASTEYRERASFSLRLASSSLIAAAPFFAASMMSFRTCGVQGTQVGAGRRAAALKVPSIQVATVSCALKPAQQDR